MATVVSLRHVVDELDALMNECTSYLNRQTGELYALQDEEAGVIEDGADPEDLPEWLWVVSEKFCKLPSGLASV